MRIDAVLAAKLATVLKKVVHGKTLAVAAAEAGLGATEVDRIMKELERELWARVREPADEKPIDPRTRVTAPQKKPAKKKARAKSAKHSGGLSLIAYADGGSRGNPGKAACAALVCDAEGAELLRRAMLLGKATNNVAEYQGVLLALELCRELGASDVTLRLDSELVVRQLEGRYRVKHPDLARLHQDARALAVSFKSLHVEHVPRDQNKVADALVNAALDGKELD